jgi:hypothetical protein
MLFKKEHLESIPELYVQDGAGENAVVYLHVHIPGSGFSWLITEYSESEQMFFGFSCLNDPQNAELGYISKLELEELAKQYPLTVESVVMTLAEAKAKFI